jgi:predicted TIM-barrel fold metal-dependent hydrolase
MHQHARFELWLNEDGEPHARISFPPKLNPPPSQAREDQDILSITLQQMEKYNIVKAVVSDENLEDVYKWKASAPSKFLAGCAFFSIDAADSILFRKEFEAKRLQVMGEIGVQYDGMAANDTALESYYALAAEFDVPVLIHCEGIGGGNHKFDLTAGNPLALQEVLIKYPNLRIYLENAGWPYFEEATALMYRYPNVYADLSTITWIIPEAAFYRYLEALIENGLGERLMYGSDQMVWPEAIGIGIERILKADFLSIEQKRNIFYNNAARFLRLADEEIMQHHE